MITLDYDYFNKHFKMIAIDLRKQQAHDTDTKVIQQIKFTANIGWAQGATIFFIIEETKETIFDFSQRIVKVLWMSSYDLATACSTILFCSNIISI